MKKNNKSYKKTIVIEKIRNDTLFYIVVYQTLGIYRGFIRFLLIIPRIPRFTQ